MTEEQENRILALIETCVPFTVYYAPEIQDRFLRITPLYLQDVMNEEKMDTLHDALTTIGHILRDDAIAKRNLK